MDVLGAGLEFADFGGMNPGGIESFEDWSGVFLVDDEDHADTHVEGLEHVGIGDVAGFLDELEDGEGGPGSADDFCLDVGVEDSD